MHDCPWLVTPTRLHAWKGGGTLQRTRRTRRACETTTASCAFSPSKRTASPAASTACRAAHGAQWQSARRQDLPAVALAANRAQPHCRRPHPQNQQELCRQGQVQVGRRMRHQRMQMSPLRQRSAAALRPPRKHCTRRAQKPAGRRRRAVRAAAARKLRRSAILLLLLLRLCRPRRTQRQRSHRLRRMLCRLRRQRRPRRH